MSSYRSLDLLKYLPGAIFFRIALGRNISAILAPYRPHTYYRINASLLLAKNLSTAACTVNEPSFDDLFHWTILTLRCARWYNRSNRRFTARGE